MLCVNWKFSFITNSHRTGDFYTLATKHIGNNSTIIEIQKQHIYLVKSNLTAGAATITANWKQHNENGMGRAGHK